MEDKNKLQEEIMKADNKTVEKMWKSIDEDHTLRAFLEKMTKDELVKIAKKYSVKISKFIDTAYGATYN